SRDERGAFPNHGTETNHGTPIAFFPVLLAALTTGVKRGFAFLRGFGDRRGSGKTLAANAHDDSIWNRLDPTDFSDQPASTSVSQLPSVVHDHAARPEYQPAQNRIRKNKASYPDVFALDRNHGRQYAQYLPPLISFLSQGRKLTTNVAEDSLEQNARLLEGVLEDFSVRGDIISVHPGPVVTLYEFEPAPGIKSSRVIGLADDIARSMSAISARVAVVPGRNAIGIELPNPRRETVYLRELVASPDFTDSKHKLAIALGKTIGGEPVIVDLAKMPHLLVAGTTGSGKSAAI